MITRLFSAALRGVEAQEVEVEVNTRGADKPIVMKEAGGDGSDHSKSVTTSSTCGMSLCDNNT